MADQKITALTAESAPIASDILPMVDDPGGTPVTKKVTIANLLAVGGALKSKVISATRNLSDASGDVAYTGVGYTPSSIIAFYGVPGTIALGLGMIDSAKGMAALQQDYTGISQDSQTKLINATTASGAGQDAILKTFDSDGFTLTWTKVGADTGTMKLMFLCLR